MKKLLAALAAAFLAASCASSPGIANPDVFRSSEDGNLIHTASETLFPRELAGFERVQTMVYNANGLDVSANYRGIGVEILLTAYVYPSDGRRRQEFDSMLIAMKQANPTLKLVEEGTSESNGQEGLRAVYEGTAPWNGSPQTVYTYGILYEHFGWYVKFRITHPKDSFSDANEFIQQFGKEFVFPGVDRRRV